MVNQRILGRTGISVGEVGLGCEGFAEMTPEAARKAMDLALDHGMNYIDLYASSPVIRDRVGDAIRGRRDRVVIQGHIGTAWENDQYLRTRDLKKAQESFEDMLCRLGTDYVDIGMIHYCDEEHDFEKVFGTGFIDYVLSLKEQGRIRHIGVSSHNPLIAEKIVRTGLVDVVMFSINPCYDMLPPNEDVEVLFEDETYRHEFFNMDPDRMRFYELCERENIAITVMKAFAGGVLLDAAQSPFGAAMTPVQCLHYALTRPGVAVALSGAASAEEVAASAAYAEATDEQKDFTAVLNRNALYQFRGHCMYCGHCAPCSVGIRIADVNKFADLCLAQNTVPETVREHYRALEHHADECIACGKCEKNCPFAVPIMEKMKQTAKLFA